MQIERRTVPGETEAQAVGEIQAIVDQLAAEDPTFEATVRAFFVRDPFEVSRDAAIVRALDRATRSVLGRAPNYIGDTPWMDAALLQAAGIETVVMGPGGGGAHAAVEWVELESVAQMAAILAEAAIDYCAIALESDRSRREIPRRPHPPNAGRIFRRAFAESWACRCG